jgi:hypothetical protein
MLGKLKVTWIGIWYTAYSLFFLYQTPDYAGVSKPFEKKNTVVLCQHMDLLHRPLQWWIGHKKFNYDICVNHLFIFIGHCFIPPIISPLIHQFLFRDHKSINFCSILLFFSMIYQNTRSNCNQSTTKKKVMNQQNKKNSRKKVHNKIIKLQLQTF